MSIKLNVLNQPEKTSNVWNLYSVRNVHARKQHDFIKKQWQESLKSSYQSKDEFNKLCSNFIECDDLVITHGQYQQKFSRRGACV